MTSENRPAAGECTVTATQTLGLSTDVTIRPTVRPGPLRLRCRSGKVILCKEHRHRPPQPSREQICRFTVYQELLVEIPLTYDAEATCTLREIGCDPPSAGPGGDEP